MENPFGFVQDRQSLTCAPEGSDAEEQGTHTIPTNTLPEGQMQEPLALSQKRPLRQTQPNALANPFEFLT